MAEHQMDDEKRVWDLPTRLFHWLLAAFVIVEFMTGSDRGLMFRIHTYLGYGILVLILFRLGWGFVGGEHALFRDFVRPWSLVREYLKSVLRLKPPAYAGHNPAGGWVILLMLAALLAIVVTGMVGAVAEGATVPFFTDLSRASARPIKNLHEFLGNAMMALVAIHLLGVLVDWGLTRDNLIRAMILGTKPSHVAKFDATDAGWLRAVLLFSTAVAFGVYLVLYTTFSR